MNFVCGVASKLMRRCDSQLPAQPVIMQHHLNKEPLMKPKLISLSVIAALTIAASSFCVIGTVRAQIDSGIGSNPHIRSQSTGAAASPGTTVVKMSQKDVNFIQKAAGGGAQEVANGKMAEKQAKSAEVRSIAARIVADHTRINKELTALANRKGVTFDTGGVKAQNLGSGDFDRVYLKWLEETHRADIAEFERAAKSADDKELKAWAAKALPTLKQHLAMAQSGAKKS
jgi:putative membrane protein